MHWVTSKRIVFIVVVLSAIALSLSGVVLASSTEQEARSGLKTAIEQGKITQEQADTRLAEWKKHQGKRLKDIKAPHKISKEDVAARLKTAIEQGKITQEQADIRLAEWKKHQRTQSKANQYRRGHKGEIVLH